MKCSGSLRLLAWCATLFLISTLLGIRAQSSRCQGLSPCIGTRPTTNLNDGSAVNYWYNSTSHQCSVVSRSCLANESLTFELLDKCQTECGVSVTTSERPSTTPPPRYIGGCNGTQQGCPSLGNDKPSWHTTAVVLGASGAGILVVLLAVTVVTVLIVRRKRRIQHRRFLENMLHLLTEDSGTDTDEWEDNPEDNNLFDRLEKHSK